MSFNLTSNKTISQLTLRMFHLEASALTRCIRASGEEGFDLTATGVLRCGHLHSKQSLLTNASQNTNNAACTVQCSQYSNW